MLYQDMFKVCTTSFISQVECPHEIQPPIFRHDARNRMNIIVILMIGLDSGVVSCDIIVILVIGLDSWVAPRDFIVILVI